MAKSALWNNSRITSQKDFLTSQQDQSFGKIDKLQKIITEQTKKHQDLRLALTSTSVKKLRNNNEIPHSEAF